MIKIGVEKIVKNGEKAYRVKAIEGVIRWSELPKKYREEGPCCYPRFSGGSEAVAIYDERGGSILLCEDQVYFEDEFLKMIDLIRKAGERLHEINKEIKSLQETWRGEETFVI